MAIHEATVSWNRGASEPFLDQKYSRVHEWRFDGGAVVRASASPHVVPPPHSDPAGVDPEEAFVASLSSCHMLFFLSLAARAGYIVEEYTDRAEGVLGRNEAGKLAMTSVTLRPRVRFGGDRQPPHEELVELHHRSHEQCFLASSVNAAVEVEVEQQCRR